MAAENIICENFQQDINCGDIIGTELSHNDKDLKTVIHENGENDNNRTTSSNDIQLKAAIDVGQIGESGQTQDSSINIPNPNLNLNQQLVENANGESEDSRQQNNLAHAGWLFKRGKISHKWKKRWFQLHDKELQYGRCEQNTRKKIKILDAEISERSSKDKEFVFTVKAKGQKRVYYLHAETEEALQNWLQVLYYAKTNEPTSGDNSAACVVQ